MLYDLSKIGWLFAAPSRILLLLALIGALSGRRGRGLAGTALALIVAASVLPIGDLAMAQLETTFPRFVAPDQIDGIVVIGGALDNADFDAYPASGFTPAFGRLYEAARLAKLYPQARLFDVGGPAPAAPGRAEADEAADVLAALGVPRARIVIERQSRNTFENAVEARAIAKPEPGQRFALVTSAFHMPRAVGCFRMAGFTVIADPVDYRYGGRTGLGFDVVGGLESLDLAVHEYFGLASYFALGRTDALWPAP